MVFNERSKVLSLAGLWKGVGKRMKAERIGRGGIIATIVYLVLIALYLYYEWTELLAMTPNEFGDFLAGVFGPLALFWLICGYLQQGTELRQNTEALKLQARELQNSTRALECQVEELRHSVEQQTRLAEHSSRQLALEIERNEQLVARDRAQNTPDLQIGGFERYVDAAPAIGNVTIKNAGPPITILGLSSNGVDDRLPKGLAELATGSEFDVMPWRDGDDRARVSIEIRFRTGNGTRGTYELSLAGRDERAFDDPVIELAS